MLDLLRANRTAFVDRLVARVVSSGSDAPEVPVGSNAEGLDTTDLRRRVDDLAGDLVVLLAEGERARRKERFIEVAQQRLDEGFAPGDFLQAVLLAPPVAREVLPDAAEDDMLALERALHEIAAFGAAVHADFMARRLKAKNEELNRLNTLLVSQEKLLSIEAMGAGRALEAANEFNRRVIESMNAGLMVVDSQTLRVTLFTSRAAEILGFDADKTLGREISEVLAEFKCFDLGQLISTVRTHGKLPLTKFSFRLPNGRQRALHVRAQRMFDASGAPRGTVVLIDDITERELLFDSLSRYVSRDLLLRLLARAEPVPREGERRSSTILFAVFAGFAALGEASTCEQLHATLDAYFRAVIDGITLHGGSVDKLVVDKVMALFTGAREPSVNAAAAARAALTVQERVAILGAERAARGEPQLAVRVGIDTGEVVLGHLGNEDRMEFTAVGDAVNAADALSAAAAPGEVLLSEPTSHLLGDRFHVEALAPCTVEGRAKPLCPYRLVPTPDAQA